MYLDGDIFAASSMSTRGYALNVKGVCIALWRIDLGVNARRAQNSESHAYGGNVQFSAILFIYPGCRKHGEHVVEVDC